LCVYRIFDLSDGKYLNDDQRPCIRPKSITARSEQTTETSRYPLVSFSIHTHSSFAYFRPDRLCKRFAFYIGYHDRNGDLNTHVPQLSGDYHAKCNGNQLKFDFQTSGRDTDRQTQTDRQTAHITYPPKMQHSESGDIQYGPHPWSKTHWATHHRQTPLLALVLPSWTSQFLLNLVLCCQSSSFSPYLSGLTSRILWLFPDLIRSSVFLFCFLYFSLFVWFVWQTNLM